MLPPATGANTIVNPRKQKLTQTEKVQICLAIHELNKDKTNKIPARHTDKTQIKLIGLTDTEEVNFYVSRRQYFFPGQAAAEITPKMSL